MSSLRSPTDPLHDCSGGLVPTNVGELPEEQERSVPDAQLQALIVAAAVAAARAAERARVAGFRPNAELWAHPLNSAGEGTEDNLAGGGAEASASGDTVCTLRELGLGVEVPGCAAMGPATTLARFLELRSAGELQDPLDLLEVPGPSISPLASYGTMQFPPRRALEIEWVAGPERPLARGGEELGRGLLTYHPSLVHMLSSRLPTPYLSGCDADRLLGLAKLYGTIAMQGPEDLVSQGPFSAFPAVDRTGTLSCGLRVTSVWPLPAFEPDFCLPLEAVIARRVKELRRKHARLHLLWSGGIDTTALVVGFLREVGTDRQSWEDAGLSVHYCPRSIPENPKFFDQYVKHLPGGTIAGHVRDFIDGERIVVTGEPADMLFGTTWMSRAFRFAYTQDGQENPMWYALDRPWQEVVPEVLRMHGLLPPGEEEEKAWLRWVHPFVQKSPIPITDVFDFSWWVVFALKWQHDMVRSFLNRSNMSQKHWDSVEHFYCTDEWQQWSYHNHASKMPDRGVWASYKYPLKRYISDFDGDAEYFASKIKVPSATYAFGYQWGLDDAFHSIEFGRLSVSSLRLREKYGRRLLRYLEEADGADGATAGAAAAEGCSAGAGPSAEEALADERAGALGFLGYDAAVAQQMNAKGTDESASEELDPALNAQQRAALAAAQRAAADLQGVVPGCEAVSAGTSFADFLQMRRTGAVQDPLDLLGVETPATSSFRDYEVLTMPIRSALEMEWAMGPERPIPMNEKLGTRLIAYHPMLPHALRNTAPSPYFSGSDEDRLLGLVRCIGQNAGGFAAVDRTGTLSCGLRVRSLFPLPAFDPGFDLSLEAVMARRVEGLLRQHSRLHVLWSGGIDTTAVLVAFFRAVGTDPEAWKRAGLSVHYGPRAVQEHPKFFERFVARLPGAPIHGPLREFIDGTRVVVAGTPADQLFSTAWFQRAFTVETMVRSDGRSVRNPMWYGLDKPWEEVMPEVLREHGCLAPSADAEAEWLRWVRPWVAKAPIPVRTVFDFGWWVSVSLKWQYDCLRVFLNRPESSAELSRIWHTVEHFYGTEEWQQWGYHNHAKKMQDKMVWASFKEPLKAYIRDFDGDVEYYAGKTKVASVRMMFGYQMGVTETFHNVSFGLLSLSGVRLQEKYGEALAAFLEKP